MRETIWYDEGDDSLSFIRNDKGIHTINTGYALVTIDNEGYITALELMGANQNFKIPNSVLKNLKEAKLTIDFDRHNRRLTISILLFAQDKEAPVFISENMKFDDLFIEHQEISACA